MPFGDRLAAAVAGASRRSSSGSTPTRRALARRASTGLAESRARLAMALADVERSAALDLGAAAAAPPRLEAAAAVLAPLPRA